MRKMKAMRKNRILFSEEQCKNSFDSVFPSEKSGSFEYFSWMKGITDILNFKDRNSELNERDSVIKLALLADLF